MTIIKKTNYGILKKDLPLNKDAINWDYIKGVLDTDGCIKTKDNSVIISQDYPEFITFLKDFIVKNFSIEIINPKIYINGTQLCIVNKEFKKFILNRKIEDYNSYYAGIFDGDGSLCSHKNGVNNKDTTKTYWRLEFGVSKQRKKDILESFFQFYNIKYNYHFYKPKTKNSNEIKHYSIHKKDDILKVLNEIKDKLVIKNYIANMIYTEITTHNYLKIIKCKFCGFDFQLNIVGERDYCDREDCLKSHNAERMREYRKKTNYDSFKSKALTILRKNNKEEFDIFFKKAREEDNKIVYYKILNKFRDEKYEEYRDILRQIFPYIREKPLLLKKIENNFQ